MLRQTFFAAPLFALLLSATAGAQEPEPGFDPSTDLPSVSLPERVTPSMPRKSAPAASVGVTRLGGTQETRDLSSAPADAIRAASGAVPPAASAPSGSQSAYRAGMVLYGKASAYDGHSLKVAGHAVRLDGIEAPAVKQVCSTAYGTAWNCGRKAAARLAELVNGKYAKCEVTGAAGHGAAATCSASQTADIGAMLVEEGLALPNRHSAGRYDARARAAMAARRGMWTGPFRDPSKWRAENR